MLSSIDSSDPTPSPPTSKRDGRPGRLVVALLLSGALALAVVARIHRVKSLPDAPSPETTQPFVEPRQSP